MKPLKHYFIAITQLLLVTISTFFVQASANEIIQYEKHTGSIKSKKVPLSPSEKNWIKTHNPIKVAVKSGWMPIEFQLENQFHSGYTIDYLQRVANLYQINFQLTSYTADSNGIDADIISSISGSSINISGYHTLDQPYLSLVNSIYINKKNRNFLKIKSLEQFNGEKVAFYKKGALADNLKSNFPLIRLVPVDIADEGFNYLRYGTVDAYVGNEFVVDYHLAVHRLKFIKKIGQTPFVSEVRMAVKDGLPELESILEKASRTIGQNNPSLMRNWSINERESNTTLKITIFIILVSFVIFSARYYQLKTKTSNELAENQKKIWQQANFDYLTNLPNRYNLHNSLEQSLLKAKNNRSKVALIFIDLDDFKHINDSSGHAMGDALIKLCAQRLTNAVREQDIVARFGGDEFMIVISDFSNLTYLEAICQKILTQMKLPYRLDDLTFYISASIGVTIYPEDSDDADKLIRFADQAMYDAKSNGRNRYSFFNPNLQANLDKRIKLSNDLRAALSDNQLWVAYQPIIDLSTNKVIKAEALIRWDHPEFGSVSPSQFIPVAEYTGLINDIGEYVFQSALQTVKLWQKSFYSNFQISINVSPVQFNDKSNSFKAWSEELEALGISGSSLVVEVTEGLLLEANTSVLDRLIEFRDAGIQVALDDFGTGYSALSYIQKFDIDYIKIDQSFVRNLSIDKDDLALCEAMIVMAHKLGLKVIAEGVETESQYEILKKLKCDFAQGYLISKPLNRKEFEKFFIQKIRLKPSLL